MKIFAIKQSEKAGLPPGTLVSVAGKKDQKVAITVIDYKDDYFHQEETEQAADCFRYKDQPTVTWINLDGVHDLDMIRTLGEMYSLGSLTLEDIVDTDHRPKMEDFGDYIFTTLKMLYLSPDGQEIFSEQVSLVFGQGFVISFQESPDDVFGAVRERIKDPKSRIRSRGADYLAYALIDSVVDQYYIIIESLGESIESLEDDVLGDAEGDVLGPLYSLRREIVLIRQSVWPLREVVSGLDKSDSDLIAKSTLVYLRDLYDHTLSIIDSVTTFKEMLSALLESHHSNVSAKMNEIMKVLTIIATIFIPLTFIAGIYGMNFDFMPELKVRWAYYGVWGVMAAVAAVMFYYFRKKRWL